MICLYLSRDALTTLRNEGWTEDQIYKYDRYAHKKEQQRHRLNRRGSVSYKDSSAKKLYNAEWEFEKAVVPRRFKNIQEAQKFAERVINTPTWNTFSNAYKFVEVREKTKCQGRGFQGQAKGHTITLSERGMNEYTLLHELAHVAGFWHHDVGFRKALLKLVRRHMGIEHHDLLKKIFRKHKLKLDVKIEIKSPIEWLERYTRIQHTRKIRDEKMLAKLSMAS